MIVFPNCKINLGLNVISKRDDGYHDLETVFYPLPFFDVLEIIENNNSTTEMFLSGIEIDGDIKNNLCVKAYNLIKTDFLNLPFLKIYLHKTIPSGAGLGGGSADGAFMLKLLNEKFNLNLSEVQLLDYALQLGSDCAFFIVNKPCFAQHRGETLEEIELTLAGYKLILINPQIHINTSWAFSQVKVSKSEKNIKQIVVQPVNNWKNTLKNDFELPVFKAHSAIQELKNKFYDAGAIYAALSGSGSTVYGIFNKEAALNTSIFPENYLIKEFIL